MGGAAAGVVVLGLVALSSAGCELLFGMPSGEDFAAPSPLATYARGSATLTLEDGTKIVLDKLSAGPHLWTTYGSEVRWSGPDGWHLRMSGAGEALPFMGPQLTFDRITDGEHWMTYSSDACDVKIEVADPKAIRGTASCEGLRWVDALSTPLLADVPPPIEGQPRFDLTVTFEATS